MSAESLKLEFDNKIIDRYLDDLQGTAGAEFLLDIRDGLQEAPISDVRDFLKRDYTVYIEDQEKADLFQHALQAVRNEVARIQVLGSLASVQKKLPSDLVKFIQKYHSDLTPHEAVELRSELSRAKSAGFFGGKKLLGIPEGKILPLLGPINQSLMAYCEWSYDYPKNEKSEIDNAAFRVWAKDNPKQIEKYPVKTIVDIIRSVTLSGEKVKTEEEAYSRIDHMLLQVENIEERQALKKYILACAGQVVSNDLYILQTLGSPDNDVEPTLMYDNVAAVPLSQSSYKHDISLDPKTGDVLIQVELKMNRINLMDGRMFVLDDKTRELVAYQDAEIEGTKIANSIFKFELTTKLTANGSEVVPSITRMNMQCNTQDLQHVAIEKFAPKVFHEKEVSLEIGK